MDWADSIYCKPIMLGCLSNSKVYFHRDIELAIPFECANNNVTGDICCLFGKDVGGVYIPNV